MSKRCIRLFLLLLGLVVVVGQVAEGRTAAAGGQAAENCTVAGVQMQQVVEVSQE